MEKNDEKKVVDEQQFITDSTKRFDEWLTSWSDMYDEMKEDLEFKMGIGQWPEHVRAQREADRRPCLRINKGPQFVDKVTGDLRQNRPSIKVRPVDDKADVDTAGVIGGLIRNIEAQSDAETVYDETGEPMATCGYGAMRVVTEYDSDDTFDQVIRYRNIPNQFSVIWDPFCKEWDMSDARGCYVYSDIPREEFEKKWPNADPCNFDTNTSETKAWISEKKIRVVEYFERNQEMKTLYMLDIDGIDKPYVTMDLPEGREYEILRQRKVAVHKIMWYRHTAKEILEGPRKIAGEYIPIVPCWGKKTVIDGIPHYNGVIRHYKDSQRLYNYERSNDAEQSALAPIAPWIVTKNMIGPYKKMWGQANKRSFPFLVYEPDASAPGLKPERNIPNINNSVSLNRLAVADQEMHDTTGIQLASLGKKSNEQSGKAIQERAAESETTNFPYLDNMMRMLRHVARITVSMIPEVYDTGRVLRVIGEDGTAKNIGVNGAKGEDNAEGQVHDITIGKYDIVVDAGPNYKTQRQEELAALIDFSQILSDEQRMLTADLIADASDWKGAQRISKRLKKHLDKLMPDILEDEETGEDEEPKKPSEADLKLQAMQEATLERQQEMQEAELMIKKAEAAKAEAEAAIAEAEAIQVASGFKGEYATGAKPAARSVQ